MSARTSSVARANGRAPARIRLRSRRSSKHLPQHDRNQARKRERYQIGGHRLPSQKANARQIARRRAIVSGANPISEIPETAAARATGSAPRAGTFARARPAMVRTAARRSALHERVSTRRGRNARPPSDSRMDMKKPAAAAARAGVTNFSMMPLCQCFARRVNLCFDFFELSPAPRSTKGPSPASRPATAERMIETKKPAANSSARAERTLR